MASTDKKIVHIGRQRIQNGHICALVMFADGTQKYLSLGPADSQTPKENPAR